MVLIVETMNELIISIIDHSKVVLLLLFKPSLLIRMAKYCCQAYQRKWCYIAIVFYYQSTFLHSMVKTHFGYKTLWVFRDAFVILNSIGSDLWLLVPERWRRCGVMQCLCPNKSSIYWWCFSGQFWRDHTAEFVHSRMHRYDFSFLHINYGFWLCIHVHYGASPYTIYFAT